MKTIRIGSGAGYSGDRIEPAVELAEKGDIQYLGFECLAERTIALAQQQKLRIPAGYDPLLEQRMRAVLAICKSKGIKIITNMGAANPSAAAAKTVEIATATGNQGIEGRGRRRRRRAGRLQARQFSAPGNRRPRRGPRQPHVVGQRLFGCRTDRAGLGRRRRCGDHRPGR